MNNLPKVVASAVPERKSNLWPRGRLSDALPISPPSYHFITMTLNCDMFYSHILQATAWLRLGILSNSVGHYWLSNVDSR